MIDLTPATRISGIHDPLDWTPEKSRLLVEACRAMALFHARHCPAIASIYARRGFDPGSLDLEADLARIPAIGVTAMKYFLLASLPEERAVLKLTSSGTKGQKTQIWFDQESLDRVQSMLDVLWAQERLISSEPANYLMVNYDPEDAKDLGIAYSDKNLQRFAPACEIFYSIKKDPAGQWEFRRKATIEKLREYASRSHPVRIMAMPAFLWELLLDMGNESMRLAEGSFVFTGGGWKAAEDKKVSRVEFRSRLSVAFGIPMESIRDNYGMAEHSAPYIECRRHRFHIPVYNRILIRDPVTFEVLPPGQEGLMEFITPFNAMMPTLALLSTDLGVIDAVRCDCGWGSPVFTVLGRGGLTRHKGCALHASEIVRRN